jgi:hypothetical protein
MGTSEELLAELLEVAQEQLRWQRAAFLAEVRNILESVLTTTQLRRAYEMCDGDPQSVEVAKAVGASKASVSNWTRRWRDLGIAYEVNGRIRHLTSLSGLGIPIEVDGE